MVGSAVHGFAGRYDLVIEVSDEIELVVKEYKRKDNKTFTLRPGRYLCDAKTSKGTYDSHFLQLAAYELASKECGYEATDGQFVLRLDASGVYECSPSFASAEDFLAVKKAYDALDSLKHRK